eukprot:CAMPEP_0181242314 /NCGR_PEP_ID=MMETSP1096-20121128/41613_1 /TAXON_ID=156174 ORGANISM="Chrysochromulina ericina, Strain CCMP281" /NCGR_SAMPLE_ID=MMETSP1096 /ASSEMBLY_ACC=CAM_ASM_000453 /LENGTH=106 /DNA_ID=CAMNT_0023338493 /DNA_START=65 /DNA_END=385 /DNA_ORIENTATION=-
MIGELLGFLGVLRSRSLWSRRSAYYVRDRLGAVDLRSRTTRSSWLAFERPWRSWYRSSRRSARGLPLTAQRGRTCALRARMSPEEVAAAVRSTLCCHVALSFDVHI